MSNKHTPSGIHLMRMYLPNLVTTRLQENNRVNCGGCSMPNKGPAVQRKLYWTLSNGKVNNSGRVPQCLTS